MFFHPTAVFKAYLVSQLELQAKYVAYEGAKDIHGNPCSCPQCKSVNLVEKVTSTMDHIVMEYEVVCKDCLVNVAYWAHGHFEPNDVQFESPSYF